jgi:hypothetical protein
MRLRAPAVQYRPAPIQALLAQTRPAPEPEPLQGPTLTCQPLQCHQPVPLQPGLMTSSP